MHNQAAQIRLEPVGQVVGGRAELTDDSWDSVEATIALDPSQFGTEATMGLNDFSHIEVVFAFDPRHPRRDRNGRAPSARPGGLADGGHLRAARQKCGPIASASASAGYCPYAD